MGISLERTSALFSYFLLFHALSPAQVVINTVAGGKIRTGVAAQDVIIDRVGGPAFDGAGNLVFCEQRRHVIRRMRADGIIETIAGTGESGFSGDGGPATAARLNGPQSPLFDAAGNLYFSDSSNFRIRKIDQSGIITTVAGTGLWTDGSIGASGPALSAQVFPCTLALDTAGNLYFSESAAGRVRRITPQGKVELVAGDCAKNCVTGDGDGGPATAAVLINPYALATDKNSNVYIGDQAGIRRVTPDGTIHTVVSGVYYAPLATDSSGALYFVHTVSTYPQTSVLQIQRLNPDGSLTTIAGNSAGGADSDGPALQIQLSSVGDISFDKSGQLYFGAFYQDDYYSTGTSRIRKINEQGIVQTIAGLNAKPAPDGTPALDAWLLNPQVITVGHDGALYIAEANCNIRKVGADGTLATVTGTGQCAYETPNGPAATTALPLISGLAVDSNNNLYIGGNSGTQMISARDGTITAVPGAPPAGSGPLQLAVDSKDRLYILPQTGYGIVRIAPNHPPENLFLNLHGGALAINQADEIAVAISSGNGDISSDPVYIFDQTGAQKSYKPGTLYASSVALDNSDNIWLTSSDFGSWLFRDTSGPLGGASGQQFFAQNFGFAGDGSPAFAAMLSNPQSLIFGPDQGLYVLDKDNARIRKISGPEPTIAPVISTGGIVNAASGVGGAIAPGELITIYGSNFGVPSLQTTALDNNSVPDHLGHLRVLFSGAPGRITAATANQINVFVPAFAGTKASVDVFVAIDETTSQPVTVPTAKVAFGLVSADSSGTGQGAILNQDSSVNSAENPAAPGSIVSLFGTGEGLSTNPLPDGALVLSTPLPAPVVSPVVVAIGGQQAEVLYAGAAPALPIGVLQINARIPGNTAPGDQPISVTIGGVATTRQVTVAVR